MRDQKYDELTTLNQKASAIDTKSKSEAYRFFWMNNFLIYSRGPLMKAKDMIRKIIEKVKLIVKEAGDNTSVGNSITQHIRHTIEIRNEMMA
jgi:hypothetical protein